MSRIVVVGAGPAGTRAVETLVAQGLRPVWIEESPANGGRIYQRQPDLFRRDATTMYGSEAAKATAIHEAGSALRARCDWRPLTLAWNLRPGVLNTLSQGVAGEIEFDRIILATGAMDRIVPIPGWTIPGVFTLGGSQIALKTQGAAIGAAPSFVGTGPLLWLVAWQYLKAGVRPVLVLDTTPFIIKARQMPGLLRGARIFAKGLRYWVALRRAGIRVVEGGVPTAIEGAEHAVALRYRDSRGTDHRVVTDAVGIGFGLKPETQLADLADVPFDFDPLQRLWLPRQDGTGRTPVAGVYVAGDGAGIAGADAAELAGARAAWAALEDCGAAVDAAAVARLDRGLAALRPFRVALERTAPYPWALAQSVADDTIVCRCERITAGELRHAASETAPHGAAPELNRAKAFSRVGMGRCQGRVCGPPAAEILAAALNTDIAGIGRLRGQPPVKPIPIGLTVAP